MKNNTQGFTLIELLIVIAIIGILAAVLIPNLLGAQKRAYDTSAQSCAKSIQTAQATYQIDNKTYATVDQLKTADGIAANCKDDNISVVQNAAPSGTDYDITVGDIRGKGAYRITASTLSNKDAAGTVIAVPTAGAPLK